MIEQCETEQREDDLAQQLERQVDNGACAGHAWANPIKGQFAGAGDLSSRRQKCQIADALAQPARPQADEDGIARSIEDHHPPRHGAQQKTDEIDADKGSKPLPADGEGSIDDLAPAEMKNEEGGDGEPHQRADDQAAFHESAAR